MAQSVTHFHNHCCTLAQCHTSYIHVHRKNLYDLVYMPCSTSHKIHSHHHFCHISCSVHCTSDTIGNHEAHLFIAGLLDIQLSVCWTEQDKTSSLTNYFFLGKISAYSPSLTHISPQPLILLFPNDMKRVRRNKAPSLYDSHVTATMKWVPTTAQVCVIGRMCW